MLCICYLHYEVVLYIIPFISRDTESIKDIQLQASQCNRYVIYVYLFVRFVILYVFTCYIPLYKSCYIYLYSLHTSLLLICFFTCYILLYLLYTSSRVILPLFCYTYTYLLKSLAIYLFICYIPLYLLYILYLYTCYIYLFTCYIYLFTCYIPLYVLYIPLYLLYFIPLCLLNTSLLVIYLFTCYLVFAPSLCLPFLAYLHVQTYGSGLLTVDIYPMCI